MPWSPVTLPQWERSHREETVGSSGAEVLAAVTPSVSSPITTHRSWRVYLSIFSAFRLHQRLDWLDLRFIPVLP